jgi:hypothetical protein
MPLFVVFVFASVVFGAGAMLAPALPTRGPRIGLAAAFSLAFVVAGSIFYAAAFGWNTLVIDYLWFAVLVGIFFAGTLSAGMYRAEAEGGTREYTGWPGPHELLFLGVVALIFIAPVLVVPVPLDTDAQGFGYLALMLKLGGSLTTLTPYYPEVAYLYSPGFPALVAYLGTQLNAGLHTIQMAIGAVLCVVFVWLAYDFGNELAWLRSSRSESRRLGIVMACCAMITTGLHTAHLDSHFTALIGLVFALAFVTFTLRYLHEGRTTDFFAAAVTLAGLPLSQPDMTIVMMLGYGPWLLTMWLAGPRPSVKRWLGLAVGIPLLAVVGIAPWLVKIAPLLGSDIRSPFEISARHVIPLVVFNGGLIVVLALTGIALSVRRGLRTHSLDMMMLIWLILVIDFSTVGLTKALIPWLPLFKYDYPFSIAWHGPIIPYMYFGASALVWLVERLGTERIVRVARQVSAPLAIGTVTLVALVAAFVEPLIAFSKTTPFQIYGAFSSHADVQAMIWLRQNTQPDDIILNHPGDHEADWAPVIAQRNTIFFRPQPFFQHTEKIEQQWQDLMQFWRDPADPANEMLLRRYQVRYVLVPQIVTRPETVQGAAFRWRMPVPNALRFMTPPRETPFLTLIQDFDGAQVWQVIGDMR